MRPRARVRVVVAVVALASFTRVSVADEHVPEPTSPEPVDGPALKATVRSRRVPSSATVTDVGADVIQSAPRRTATDLLRLAPGLVPAQHGGEGKAHQLFVRGFDAVHGQDVEVVVGGLRVNEVSHVHALGYADTNFVIPELVSRLRFAEGASRAEQGDFAVAGTLQFDLGLDRPGLLARLEGGSFGHARGVAAFRPEGDARTFVAVSAAREDGFGPRRASGRVSALGQWGRGFGAFDVRVLGGASVAEFETAGVVREADVLAGRTDLFAATDEFQSGRTDRVFVLAEGTRRHTSGDTVLTASVQRTSLALQQDFTGYLRDPVFGDGIRQSQDGWQARVETIHRTTTTLFDRPLKLAGALGLRFDTLDQSQVPYDGRDGTLRHEARLRDWHVDLLDAFAWLEAAWKLDSLQLRFGTRLDQFVSYTRSPGPGAEKSALASGLHPGLKGGLSWNLPDDVTLSVDYGEGFRSPFAPALVQGQRTPFTRIRTLDLGARHDTASHALAATLFGSHVEDDVFFDHLVARTSYIGPTARFGIGVRGSLRLDDLLLLNAHATAAHAVELATNTRLPGFVPLVGRVDAAHHRTFTLGSVAFGFHAGLGLTAVGPRPLRDGTFGDGYLLVDARVALRWTTFELALDATNLFDARWFDGTFSFPSHFDRDAPASALPARHVTAGAPRRFFLSLAFVPEDAP